MRPGPSTEELAGPVAVGVRVNVARAGRIIATDVPATNVQVDVQESRTVPGQVTFTAPSTLVPVGPYDPLANFGQRVQIICLLYVDGTPWEIPLGWYLITDWAEQAGGGMQVTCADLLRVLDEDPLPWPSSPPVGATLRTEAQRLAAGIPVMLDDIADRGVSRESQWGTSRTEALAALCTACGVGYTVRPDGYLHLYRQGASSADVVATYRGWTIEPERAAIARQPNRWIVAATAGSGDAQQQYSSTVSYTSPPYDPASYGWVTERVELSGSELTAAAAQQRVAEEAQHRLRMRLISARTRSVEIPLDPRLETGDVVVVESPGETITGRVTAYSMPLSDTSARMRVDLDVLEW